MIVFDGFKFGLFIQLSIGPVALMVLNTSIQLGYKNALIFMTGTIIINILYTILACMGISKLFQKNNLQIIIKIMGAVILLIFGINNILNFFDISILPKNESNL